MPMIGTFAAGSARGFGQFARRFVPGLSAGSPAANASAIKSADPNITNGAYYYQFNDGVRQLYTDFTSFSNYPMVMVTRISPNDQNQYLTTENNVADLATTPNNTTPSRSAKISDAAMNEIIIPNSIRWVIVGPGHSFYRLDDSPQWYSNHGANQSCGYDRGFHDAYATPSNTPSWYTRAGGFFGAYDACGGVYTNENTWMSLSGIHINDGVYFGGYSGESSRRGSTPSPYQTTGSNSSWSQGGYVFLNW
jgi:hypothetical protein